MAIASRDEAVITDWAATLRGKVTLTLYANADDQNRHMETFCEEFQRLDFFRKIGYIAVVLL